MSSVGSVQFKIAPCSSLYLFSRSIGPLLAACASQVYTAQAPGCSARALSEVGPMFRARPRSKSVRFSCTLQGHRHGLVRVLRPSQVRAVQATRCLMSVLSLGTVRLNHLPGPSHSGGSARAASQVCRASPLGS